VIFSSEQFVIIFEGMAILFLTILFIYQEIRLKKLFKGEKGANLESLILAIKKKCDYLEKQNDSQETKFQKVFDILASSVRKTSIVRFNPWEGAGEGGNQSFSAVWLSDNGDGLVLTALHSREKICIFSKPISKFKSHHTLTNEEKQAILQASDGNAENDKK